jgi:O-antigen/teichoic acid export membrane protein
MTKHNDSVFSTIVQYSASRYYRQFLGIFVAILRPKLLSPALYGLWSLLRLIERYASYTHLGARTAMRYRIPFHESRGEDEQIKTIIGTTFKWSLWMAMLSSVLLIGASFRPGLTLEVRAGLLSFSVVVVLLWYYGHIIALLKAQQDFKLISAANYIYFTAIFVCSVLFIYLWGIYGAYLSVIVPLMIVIPYLRSKYTRPETNPFDRAALFELIKKGFPIVLFNVTALLISTADRFVIAGFLGKEQLGYYGIATMCMGFMMNTPGASREVVEPKMMQSFGKNSTEEGISEYFLRPLVNSAYLMPFLVGAAFFLLPLVIPVVLPKYVAGVAPSQILVLGSYALALSYTVRGIIIAKEWQVQASGVMVVALVVNVLLNILLIRAGFGIVGVAVASAVSFYALLILLLVFVSIKDRFISKRLRATALSLCYPCVVMLSSIFLLEYFGKYLSVHVIVLALLKLLLFTLICFTLAALTHRTHTLARLFAPRKQ